MADSIPARIVAVRRKALSEAIAARETYERKKRLLRELERFEAEYAEHELHDLDAMTPEWFQDSDE